MFAAEGSPWKQLFERQEKKEDSILSAVQSDPLRLATYDIHSKLASCQNITSEWLSRVNIEILVIPAISAVGKNQDRERFSK